MKTLRLLSLSIVIASLAIAASAQQGMRRGGGNYDPATEATLTGTVDAVSEVPSSAGGGLHFTLTAPSGLVDVHVGPASFVESKNFTIAKGDGLTVVGSKTTMAGQAVVIAREIKKGDQVLTLRDANGLPVWSARSQGQTASQQPNGPPQQAQATGACMCCTQGMPGMNGMAGMHGMHGTRGMPAMQGVPAMQGMQNDMQVFHLLLANRDKIRREVTNLSTGIESVTRSTDPAVAALLKAHVPAMVKRLEDGRPIHQRDPLFAEIFRHAPQIKVTVEPLEDGVHVVETSDDPYVARLIQEHAGVVSLFLERGMTEMHRNHPVPPQR